MKKSFQSGTERERRRGKEKAGLLSRGVVLQLSLAGGRHGKGAVRSSRASNRSRRCLCHHGDGAVPREVVMG